MSGAKHCLLCLKLIKHNQRIWSHFKETLDKSSHKPSVSYTIDWSLDVEDRTEARDRAHNKQQTQQHSSTSMLNFLFGIKLFQDTPVQYRHENFVKQVTVITALLLVVAPIPPAAEIQVDD